MYSLGHWKNPAHMAQLLLALHLIAGKTGTKFFSQPQNLAMAIT